MKVLGSIPPGLGFFALRTSNLSQGTYNTLRALIANLVTTLLDTGGGPCCVSCPKHGVEIVAPAPERPPRHREGSSCPKTPETKTENFAHMAVILVDACMDSNRNSRVEDTDVYKTSPQKASDKRTRGVETICNKNAEIKLHAGA